MTYDHTQKSWLFINLFMLLLIMIILAYIKRWGTNPIPFWGLVVILAVFLIVLSIFYQQRVRVDDSGIHIIYGIGLIHINIIPERVEQVRIVRNPWYYGLGIRFTPRGMLYSIQGLDAVEMVYVKGTTKQVRIGSNDCLNLNRAIETRYHVPQTAEIPPLTTASRS